MVKCRDLDTGRLLPNQPHVRIFLLRLMRLLYHLIKPVVVFDGPMPEVKRREIQRRRDRQEKFWRNADDDDGNDEDGGGGGALKRDAKKILVQRLQEYKQNEARMLKEKQRTDEEETNNLAGEDDAGMEGGGRGRRRCRTIILGPCRRGSRSKMRMVTMVLPCRNHRQRYRRGMHVIVRRSYWECKRPTAPSSSVTRRDDATRVAITMLPILGRYLCRAIHTSRLP